MEWLTSCSGRKPAHPVRLVEGGDSRQQSVQNAGCSGRRYAWWWSTDAGGRSSTVRPSGRSFRKRRVRRRHRRHRPVDTVKQVRKNRCIPRSRERLTLPDPRFFATLCSGRLSRRLGGRLHCTDDPAWSSAEEVEVSVSWAATATSRSPSQRHGPGPPLPVRAGRAGEGGLSWASTAPASVGTFTAHSRPAARSGRRGIPSELGLDGHSDADVLAHAITMPARRGRPGRHRTALPGHRPRWAGAESSVFLRHASSSRAIGATAW